MIELSALLFGTAFFGGNLANTLVGGVLGNTAYDTIKGFLGLRERLLQPSPHNHDLQKAVLQALAGGIQSVTRRHLPELPKAEQNQVKTWQKQVLEPLKQLQQEIEQDRLAWQVTEDMGMLLSASHADLYALETGTISSELQQFKARYEKQFLQLAQLPSRFREAVKQEWLAATYLHLAEAIKTEPRVSEMFQTSLLLDTQDRVQNIETLVQEWVNRFNHPQQFLDIVQPGVTIDIEPI